MRLPSNRSFLSTNCSQSFRLIAHFLDLGWLSEDVVAGLTVGIVVVPQGMSYAQVRLLSFNLFHSRQTNLRYSFLDCHPTTCVRPLFSLHGRLYILREPIELCWWQDGILILILDLDFRHLERRINWSDRGYVTHRC